MASADSLKDALNATGKFRVKHEIVGGMNATAFLAYHRHLQHDVFLKVYDYVEEDAAEALREPRLLVQATREPPKPENIVEVFDTDILKIADEKFVCLQMEYVKGESLLDLLDSGPLGQQDAVRIALGILRGVLHLHHRRMVHRDLKPANILLSGGVPKIADFGSVAVVPDPVQSVSASRHSALYVPPEGWSTPSSYVYGSDIYQVGIVLHELVNGALRYDQGIYLTQTVLRSLDKPFEDLDSYEQSKAVDRSIAELTRRGSLLKVGGATQPYVSKKVTRAIRGAMNPDPDRRFSGRKLLERLSSINVPNWRPLPNGAYEARDWDGWDLRLEYELRKGAKRIVMKRRRVAAELFRRYQEFASVSEAAQSVEP